MRKGKIVKVRKGMKIFFINGRGKIDEERKKSKRKKKELKIFINGREKR